MLFDDACLSGNNASQAIRLVGGANEAEGRVEVLRGGNWGSICDDGWGLNEASVICRMLCYKFVSSFRFFFNQLYEFLLFNLKNMSAQFNHQY